MAAPLADPQASSLQSSLYETYEAFVDKVLNSLPELLGALVLLAVGWAVAYVVRIAVQKLITGLDSFLPPALRVEWLRSSALRVSYAKMLGRVAFWAVMLFFIAAAANLIGWSLFTDWTQSVVRFLPQLITGMIIIFAGILLGSGVGSITTRAAASAKFQRPELIGRVSQLAIVFTMAIIGVEQLGINVHFLTESLVVIVGVFFAGGALAFGLGARTLAANVIGAQNCRKTCRIGQEVSIRGITGTVAEITATTIILETSAGQAVVPAGIFDQEISLIATKPPAPANPPKTESTSA